MPAGWEPTEYDHWFVAKAEKDLAGPSNLVLSSGCQGSCSAKDIPKNIAEVIASIKKNANRPNLNTGGTVITYRVTYSDEILASGPYQQRVSMRGFLHREGDEYDVELSGGADIEYEQARLPEMLAACESARIEGPPAAEPETPAAK